MHHPARAGAAEAGEGEAGGREPLRDIARRIDPQEEERHAARARPLHGWTAGGRPARTTRRTAPPPPPCRAAGPAPPPGTARRASPARSPRSSAGRPGSATAASGELGAAACSTASTASRASSRASWKAIWKPRLSRGSISDSIRRAAGRVVAAERAVERPDRDGQPVPLAQPLGEGVVHLGRRDRHLGGDRLGGLLQLGENDWRARRTGRAPPRWAAGCAGPDGSAIPPASSRATRQARYSASTARAALGLDPASCAQFRLRHRVRAEQRVGEHLAQLDLELPLLAAREHRELHPQRLRQLDEQRGGDGALVVLDEVQVAGRDAEPRRQRLLRKLPLGRSRRTVRPIRVRVMFSGFGFTRFTDRQASCANPHRIAPVRGIFRLNFAPAM